MNELAMLHALEEIRDFLAPVVVERAKERLYPIKGLTEAHRTAHYMCESCYAAMEAEAHACQLAEGAEDYDPNRHCLNPPKPKRPVTPTTPREIKEQTLDGYIRALNRDVAESTRNIDPNLV